MEKRISLIYDPARDGYNAQQWTTISGTPSVVNDYLRLNAAEAIHNGDFLQGIYTFNVKIPTSPATGDARRWGLYSNMRGAGMYFDINGTAFTAQVVDNGTGFSQTKTLTWDTSFAGTDTKFKIQWEPGIAKFFIGDTKVDMIQFDGSLLANNSLRFYLKNGNADNMDVRFIEAQYSVQYLEY